ncbi:hypothetical protein OCI51_26065 (plasmid) [Lysinibacillus capsici]|uniref:hypothetical protein n=1 Tax=Lysinibacillus capsici TaxID=2115968 RepID=UPI0021D8949C|nr:hypothetical protein [Lysinibacillus capsici]UYB50125.1 hypothetical protein OCI51_26065 [Lysinibacillus capsici]
MKKITKKMRGSYLKDLHSFADAVIELYNYDKHNFFRNFVNLDFIPDVVSLKMKREDMDFLESSFTQAIKTNDEEVFFLTIKRIFLAYKSLFQNLESNNKRLDNCKFLDRSQVQTPV